SDLVEVLHPRTQQAAAPASFPDYAIAGSLGELAHLGRRASIVLYIKDTKTRRLHPRAPRTGIVVDQRCHRRGSGASGANQFRSSIETQPRVPKLSSTSTNKPFRLPVGLTLAPTRNMRNVSPSAAGDERIEVSTATSAVSAGADSAPGSRDVTLGASWGTALDALTKASTSSLPF